MTVMHRSSVQLQLHEQAPVALLEYFDGRPHTNIEVPDPAVSSEPDSRQPRKRRKVTKSKRPNAPSSIPGTGGYVTLARVDVGLIFNRSSTESYPSPPLNELSTSPSEHPVLLTCFSEELAGEHNIQIITEDGHNLLDTVSHAKIATQTLDVLRLAVSQMRCRGRKNPTRSTCTISKTAQCDDGTSESDGIPAQTFHLCVRVSAPDSRDCFGSIGPSCGNILELCAPEGIEKPEESWSPRDFYDSVHVPETSGASQNLPVTDQLRCKMYPFQRRAVQWLLQREGAGQLPEPSHKNHDLHHGFVRATDAEGRSCLVSRFLGIVTTDEDLPLNLGTLPRGGILAEEMGLGKTVEMIALICLHRRDAARQIASQQHLPQCSATLILTPPAILRQWKNELETLAPSLNVMIYEGLKIEAGKSDHTALISKCMSHDVVLTTYNVLAKEIHYAETPRHDLRHEKKYEKRMSPLTQIVWWRVVLDEAQMVESGVTNAAKVAKLIPRELAWCVSGTPVKKDARDLFGFLDFLNYRPYCDLRMQMWDRLVAHHKETFKQIFGSLALRHTKDQIKNEIQLPPQKRVVITVPFTQIEEQHYSTLFKEMSEDCGLDVDGAPLKNDWDPESVVVIEKMRTWLTRLRQTCLHPEVGAKNRRALGNGKGPLRTVGEVLEVMIEQNDTIARSEERALFLSQIRRGQIMEHAELSEEALDIWLHTLAEAKSVVQESRGQLKAEISRLGLREDLYSIGEIAEADAATATRTGSHRQRLRAAIEIEHMCTFFVANAYFQIKSDESRTTPNSDEFHELERKEELKYEQAKILRKELLQEVRKRAEAAIQKINDKTRGLSLVVLPQMPPFEDRAGIESRAPIDRLNDLINVMHGQAKQLHEWREKTIELLVLPLVDEEDSDTRGDEYETSTKQQDEVYVFVDALRALIADRHDILTGQQNELIKHEMDIALKQAKEGKGHSPGLLIQLLTIRSKLLPETGMGSVRGLFSELRELKTTLRSATERGSSRAAAEMLIINGALKKLQKVWTEQTKAVTGLEREIELFKDTMNLRLEYYRQLQQISDTVAPFEEEMDEQTRHIVLLNKEEFERNLKARIASLKSKGRYLIHLRDEANNVESQKMCIICQSQFELGVLTSCGHSYCADCFRLWWNTHRNCPACKKHLRRDDFHQITYKPQELTMAEEGEAANNDAEISVTKDSEISTIYSGIRDNILNQIKNIDLDGSFGTKIDTLARHILWIREHDPGAKSIVFSQYKDFLDVLGRAFGQFKIGFTGIDRKDGIQKFKNDPGMECFFLHAKAHSSGLNLVNATHVFLCEPLINTAIELQAIARVHRIGQQQPTTVWMYLVENSVERAIYQTSVTRRLTLMGKTAGKDSSNGKEDLEHKIEAANTLEMEETPIASLLTKGTTGGEVVAQDDLWSCLFRQKLGQAGRVPQEAEREVAQHLGAQAAEARFGLRDEAMTGI